ncbi:hypothetical protein PPL_11580 [Heterostelium album PN500]|uniref:Protein kinase domain-containing protein n=1 Tax=Heterostelium pallidum (strain ATCC 26659 / Pp 5 / PN500) TaxID=670386 RepID=D3BVI9_HETP5|nr:hypothetical protein PPL_11580 [Heterostelium album PN500]EFA74612.1 hypothetical protein PPL_11580 [Heterostelium album PN500]|eukprot:XP_020426746.1 hypothetical protein PPL_11580 [Heterostelium album PN500]
MNNIELTDKLINRKNVLKFINFEYFREFIVLVYNHLKDKENEQHTNITLIGYINQNNNEIVIPDTVDTQYQLIIINSYPVDFKSICVELLNKSQSYTINFENNLFKNNLDYFKKSHIINNKRYHSISRFTNSNAINDVYLVCGTYDHRLVRSFFNVINQLTIVKLTKSIQKYVYKKINYKDNQKYYERAENEIKAMKLLKDNPRFVQLVDYHHDKDNQIFHIITQYCYGGDLSQKYKHVTDINLIFEESYIRNYISQLFNILLDLDKHGIVHCDIKPLNIFIDESDAYGTLILGDFGCCEFIDQSTIIEYQDTKEHTLETNDFNLKTIDHEISEPTFSNINATRGTKGYISPVIGVLPKSLESLSFGLGFNQILSVGVLPESLKSLVFGYSFNQILSVGVLPKSLESLVFGNRFSQILSIGVLPKSLESLEFGNRFNQILSVGVLPESLKSLKFGNKFNQILSIGVLPESLESLVFGNRFNQKLSVGVLPESLKLLEFGNRFNQILSVGVLPKSLESLVFGNKFNQILSVDVLPESLKSLSMTNYIDRKDLPQNIEILFIRGQRIDIDSF